MACLTLGGQEDHRAKRSLPGHYKSTNAPPACLHASRSARTSDTAHAVPAPARRCRMRAECLVRPHQQALARLGYQVTRTPPGDGSPPPGRAA
jgi:hypothetical protein